MVTPGVSNVSRASRGQMYTVCFKSLCCFFHPRGRVSDGSQSRRQTAESTNAGPFRHRKRSGRRLETAGSTEIHHWPSTALAGFRHGPCRLMGLVPAKTCGWVGRASGLFRSARQGAVVVSVTFFFFPLGLGFQVSGSRRFAGGNEACGIRSHVDNRLRPAGAFLRMASVERCRCSAPRPVLAARRAIHP